MTVNYNRGKLYSGIAMVLFLGGCILIPLFLIPALNILTVIMNSGLEFWIIVALLIMVILSVVFISIRLLLFSYAIKFEQETLMFSGQVIQTIKLDDLDFVAYDETFQNNSNGYQILLGFSDDLAKTMPLKVQKKLVATKANQNLLVLNFTLLDDKAWYEFWTMLSKKTQYIDSILLDKQGVLDSYRQKNVSRTIRREKIVKFILVVIVTLFILQMLDVDRLFLFDVFH